MSTFGGSHSSWFLRVEGQNKARNSRQSQGSGQQQQQQPIDTSVLAPFGREIIMNPRAKLTGYQLNPPIKSYPTCFAKAIVGLESRCTRPYCQNIIGGNDLTESLRRTLFTQLASRMVKYQRIDQDIVHPATGADVPIVQPENITILEGESAPRSRIQVALLGRFGNTSVPNAMALELSLLARGFNVKTIHFDRPDEIPIAQAAELFKNQSILVAPQGEGLGYATWMAPGTTVISLLPRFTRSSKVYTDRMMAFGKRFFAWDCQDESCVQPDRDLAHDCIEQTEGAEGESITAQEYEDFVQMKVDFRERSLVWKRIVDCYAKDVSRRLHVEELTTLIESLAADFGTPDAAAAAQSDSSKAQISKRGAEGDENEDEDQEAGQDMDEAGKQEEEDVNALEQDDDMENDGTIRIQPGAGDGQKGKTETETEAASEQEEEDEDINFHEYDTNVPEEDEDKAEGDGDADTTAPPPLTKAAPPPPAVKTLQQADAETGRGTAGGAVATKKAWAALPITQVAVPLLTFPEFCKRGRCCGSAEGTAPVETMGTSKALTPCAASMSAIVLGPQGVWGESESTTSPSSSSPPSIVDTRGKVWQVDLDRELA
ncbi:hypothetical protein BG004_003107 [Podila humilis]|nr:hypothetical protein BG004_003107 [Podila humilis]